MNKSQFKRICLLLMILCCVLLLSGCSFSDLMSKGTGITKDPDYQTWEKLAENGKLDAEGKYTADAVHISLAGNSFLDVHYFSDPEMSKEFEKGVAYLLPGDMIYASVNQKEDARELYLFDHFNIIEYTSDNKRGSTLDWGINETGTSLMVPYDYKGTEVSVEPAGHFGKRTMILSSSLADNTTVPEGEWKIDGKEQGEGSVQLNPLDTCSVEYAYDPEKYYVVSTKPECWKKNDEIGLVIFDPSKAKTGEEKYEVNLNSYITAEITVKEGEITGIDTDSYTVRKKDNKSWSVYKLKEDSGFTVVTTSNADNNITCSQKIKIGEAEEKEINGQKRYAYKVELGDENSFVFIPSDYLADNGRLRFIYNGQEINERTVLNSGNTITVEAAETAEGYWLPDNGRQIAVHGKETAKDLKQIKFYPEQTVTVLLDKPAAGGTVTYYCNGRELTDPSAELVCGNRITVKVTTDEGWESQIDDNDEYIVSELNNQVISFNGKGVNDFFQQMDSYKPILRVRGNGNLGNKCKITVEAKGYKTTGATVKNGTVGTDVPVGTDEKIRISFSNMDFGPSNNAVLLSVKKKTSEKEYREYYYANQQNKTVEISFAKDKHYREVNVDMKAVKGEKFQTYQFANADIVAVFNDMESDGIVGAEALSSETYIHDDRKLSITIIPGNGYTMVGSDTSNGVYSRKDISYKDYKKQIKTIVPEQLKKGCVLNLDNNDPYGVVEYRQDGKICSGSVIALAGDKISISYRITAKGYKIDYKNTGTDLLREIFGWTGGANNENSCTIEIEVKPEMDGTTITRKQFIKVMK